MKVAYLTSGFEGCGIRRYSSQLVPELCKYVDVSSHEIDWPNKANYFAGLAEACNSADLIHVEFESSLFSGTLPMQQYLLEFSSKLKAPSVLTCHGVNCSFADTEREGDSFRSILNGLRRKILSKKLRPAFESFGHIALFSAEQQRQLLALGVSPERTSVLLHPIPEIHSSAEFTLRDQYGLSGKKVLAIAGNIHKDKGYELVLEVLAELPADIVLIIAGKALSKELSHRMYESALKRKVVKNGLQSRVIFLDNLGDKEFLEVYQLSDLMLFPYLQAHGSSTLCTALALGKKTLASNLPAFLELKKEVPAFETFQINSREDLLAGIIRMLSSAPVVEDGTDAAIRNSAKKLSYAQRAKDYLAIYEREIDESRH